MFKLFNEYPVSKLLKKVQWNARAMLIAYTVFICLGIVSLILVINNALNKSWIGVLMVVMMLAAMLILMAPFLLYDYFSHKHKQGSLFIQNSSSLEMWDQKIRESEKIGDRIGVSDEYIFSARSSFYIPSFFSKDTIKAIYTRRYYRKGRLISDPDIYVICEYDELYKLPMGGKLIGDKGGLVIRGNTLALDEWILSKIHAHMPHVHFGIYNAHSLTRNPLDLTPLSFNISEQI